MFEHDYQKNKDKSQDKNRISHLGQIHEEVSAYWRKIKAIF